MQYKDLSVAAHAKLLADGTINGCGPENWRGQGPNWFFRASCLEHDYNYAVGGTEADRRWSDWGFYAAMVKDTLRLSWYLRPFARFQAWLFFKAVRLFGKKHFHYGEKRNLLDGS